LPKKRDKNGEEFYRGKLREAQKQIRELQRRVKELQKAQHIYEDILTEEVEEPVPETTLFTSSRTCPHCGKGKLSYIEIVGRVFEKCDICEYRKKINGP
jgi:DNA-directed RNA polymerase subunit M/transcription elongation factor TFIIS